MGTPARERRRICLASRYPESLAEEGGGGEVRPGAGSPEAVVAEEELESDQLATAVGTVMRTHRWSGPDQPKVDFLLYLGSSLL